VIHTAAQPRYDDDHQDQSAHQQSNESPQQSQQFESRPPIWYCKDLHVNTRDDESMRARSTPAYLDLSLLVQCDIDFSRPNLSRHTQRSHRSVCGSSCSQQGRTRPPEHIGHPSTVDDGTDADRA
jgi:hypothetical protein